LTHCGLLSSPGRREKHTVAHRVLLPLRWAWVTGAAARGLTSLQCAVRDAGGQGAGILPAPLGRPVVRSRQPASSPGSGSPGSGSVVAGSSIGFASAGFGSHRRRTGALHQRPPADVTLYGAETVDVRRKRTTNRRTAAGPLRCMAPHGPELSRTPEPDHSAAASAAELPSCHPPLPHPCRDNSEPQPDLHGRTPPLPDRAGPAVRHS
jgi:hypothetical protein